MEDHCNGPLCQETNLIKAHIIARAFARMYQRRNKKHNLELSLARVTPTQLGIFDKQILCERCDGLLGKHDDYLSDVIRKFVLPPGLRERDDFSSPKVDCDAFCKGILAILWRGSISSHPDYSDVSLGPYEPIVRDILFGLRPLSDMPELEVVLQYYRSDHFGEDVNLFYTLPVQNKFEGRNGFSLGLNGFRITAKIDQRPFSPAFGPYIINRTGVFRGLVVDLEKTPEFSRMADIAVAEMSRNGITPADIGA
jgi:hypothetical protein